MDKLEFYDRYQLYSTADLIKIVRERRLSTGGGIAAL